jgi:inositol oxygenase
MGAVKRGAARLARGLGYEVRRVQSKPDPWREQVRAVTERRNRQTVDDVRALTEKYRAPIFGTVRVWDLVERLALCIDGADPDLRMVSQHVHALQVVEGMFADGVDDPDLLVAGMVHDIGKVLLLVGEDPANVGGMTRVIDAAGAGAGLDNCVMQWGHDEFGYSRLKDHVPEHVAWLIRYHSVDLDACGALMDERDRRLAARYLEPFTRYDAGTKSAVHVPSASDPRFRDLVERAFPDPIVF